MVSGRVFCSPGDKSLKEYAHGMIDQGVEHKCYAPDVAPRTCLLHYLQPAHRVTKYTCNLQICELRLFIVAWQDSSEIQINHNSKVLDYSWLSTSGSRWTAHASAGVWHTNGRRTCRVVLCCVCVVAATRCRNCTQPVSSNIDVVGRGVSNWPRWCTVSS